MNKQILTLVIIFLSFTCNAQNAPSNDLVAYFSALIVEDLEKSISWYSDNLGFAVVNRTAIEGAGFKQANLKREDILIELIELKTAISPKDAIPEYNNKTRILGFFKVGFAVSDFDLWIRHLEESKVEFHGKVVIDNKTGKKMVIIKDPDGNRIQFFEK